MGMYDSIRIDVKCPYCEEVSEVDAQTKDFDCELKVYKVGDFLGDERLDSIICSTGCRSKSCLDYEKRYVSWSHGFGRVFSIKIFLNKGVVTCLYEIEHYDKNAFSPFEKRIRKLKNLGYE